MGVIESRPLEQETALHYAPREAVAHFREDGSVLLTSPLPLGDLPRSVVDALEQWAGETPDRVFLGQRVDGDWQTLTYGEAWRRVRGVAQGLLEMGLSDQTPIAILSPASIEHAILTFAALLAGVPVAPISPSYSQIPGAIGRLEDIAEVLRPSLVFAQSVAHYGAARAINRLASATWMGAGRSGPDHLGLAVLYDLAPGKELAAARAQVSPDTVAKILFTSGSTGAPKGVINTHGMIAASSIAGRQLARSDTPPVLLDWLPWHHTMGGNSVLHGVVFGGGSLYIDDGRPTPADFHRTIANIRSVRPTSLLSVPAALQMLADALESDDDLREAFFSRLERMSFAGASLPQDIWERFQALALRTLGREVDFGSGYGATETGPGISTTHWRGRGSGEIGLPYPGLTMKLVPVEGRFEVRVKGPNVTPGYFRSPELTAAAFDDEGYYQLGDLVEFVNPTNPAAGLRFAGRLSENFKLTNGSWVATSELRIALLEALQPLALDLVIAGADRDDLRLMIWPTPAARRQVGAPPEGGLGLQRYRDLAEEISQRLEAFNGESGKTHRVAAFRILQEPPSLGAGETTDKGYVNQRGVLRYRAELVEDLYSRAPSLEVIAVVSPGRR